VSLFFVKEKIVLFFSHLASGAKIVYCVLYTWIGAYIFWSKFLLIIGHKRPFMSRFYLSLCWIFWVIYYYNGNEYNC